MSTAANANLKAPFPYFGGKSAVADLVWERLGDVDNYVEPFAGSLAVLLRRPHAGRYETVNDRNHYLVNFWRSVQQCPLSVAEYADAPVTEADLHARHDWLLDGEMTDAFCRQIESDPEFCQPQFAGWWVWGMSCWIGAGWCERSDNGSKKRPILDCAESRGVASLGRPQLGDAFDIGRGVNANKHADTCEKRRRWLLRWIGQLSDRLRLVRVCYGHWSRVCESKTTLTRLGRTGVFLDPPYAKSVERVQSLIGSDAQDQAGKRDKNRAAALYDGDRDQDIDALVAGVNRWCQRWGCDAAVRIVLAGYEGEHDNLVRDHGWTVEHWKPNGGYGNRTANYENKNRERLWVSPACPRPEQVGYLF